MGLQKAALMSSTGVRDQFTPAARASRAVRAEIACVASVSSMAASASGLASGRVRHSDALIRFSHRVPVLRVVPRRRPAVSETDRLRNALQLHPLRQPMQPGAARIITFTRLDGAAPADAALALAHSFAAAGTRTLLVDADLAGTGPGRRLDLQTAPGWRELLQGDTPAPHPLAEGLDILPAGLDPRQTDTSAGIGAIRRALAKLTEGRDLILICAPGPNASLMTELLLSACDLGLAEVGPNDRKATVAAHVYRLDNLPRQGGGLVFTQARTGDPGLPA